MGAIDLAVVAVCSGSRHSVAVPVVVPGSLAAVAAAGLSLSCCNNPTATARVSRRAREECRNLLKAETLCLELGNIHLISVLQTFTT